MPPRGNEGLDFTPILTHYVFLSTTILAIAGWFVAFIGQIVAQAQGLGNSVGTLWFAIFLQLFLILGVLHTLATDAIAMQRFQVSIFGAIAIVFAVVGVNSGIFTGVASLDAMAAGWLLLAIVDIIWVLYFTSEEDSLMLYVFNSMGTGGLTPPSRRRRTRTPSMHNMGGGNGYGGGYSSGAGIGSGDVGYDSKMAGGMGGGIVGGGSTVGMRSPGSIGGGSVGGQTRSIGGGNGAGSITHVGGGGGPGSIGGGDNNANSNSPLIGGSTVLGSGAPLNSPGLNSGDSEEPTSYGYKAKALYAYTASPDDPNEISFTKGEILDILDKQGKWWQAKRSDGTVGIAPSNYLQIV